MLKDQLKKIRESMRLTKKQVADAVGVTERAYITYEYGQRDISTETLTKLADFYGVTTDYLLGREQPDQPPDRIQQVARDFGLTSSQTGILAAYLYMDKKDREQLVSYIKQLAEGESEECDIYTAGEIEDFRADALQQDNAG